MNQNSKNHTLPVAGVLLAVVASASAQDLQKPSSDSPNHITASFRYGLNIKGSFKGVGNSFLSGAPFGTTRQTPAGDPYNYDNGYVYADVAYLADPSSAVTTYWGFDFPSQVFGAGNQLLNLDRTFADGIPGENSANASPSGFEIKYNYELGTIEKWGHMRYGVEAAFNFMPISFRSGSGLQAGLFKVTDTYNTADGASLEGYVANMNEDGQPYQNPNDAGTWLNYPDHTSSSVQPNGTSQFLAQQKFDANLWGFRLGPYVEWPLVDKLSLHLSAGLAVGLLDARASWGESLTPNRDSSLYGNNQTGRGDGSNFKTLWGFYAGADATYQLCEHWGVDVGVQFQDLGTYSHDFTGRTAELDLSKSLFIQAGLSYSF